MTGPSSQPAGQSLPGPSGSGAEADRSRALFVRAVLWGRLSGADLAAAADHHRVDTASEYVAVRARGRHGLSTVDLARSLGLGVTHGRCGGGMAAVVDGDLVGFLPGRPHDAPVGVLGVGPARPLPRLHESFRMASRALRVADRSELDGVCDFSRLGLLPGVLFDDATGEALSRRYLEPLGDNAFAAELIETLRVFLMHGLQATRTARVLCVHTNTVRYRVAKFEDLTGTTFRGNPIAAFELLWALEHQAARSEPDHRAEPPTRP